MKRFTPVLALAAIAATATLAYAVVTFDSASGTGFVGKGDVQVVFGWNNAQLQANAGSLAFTYTDETVVEQECEKIVESKKETKVLTKTAHRTRSVNATVAYEARKNSQLQVTGFWLTGYAGGSGDLGDLPTDICPDANDNPAEDGWHPTGPLNVVSSTGGELMVNGMPFPPPPVL